MSQGRLANKARKNSTEKGKLALTWDNLTFQSKVPISFEVKKQCKHSMQAFPFLYLKPRCIYNGIIELGHACLSSRVLLAGNIKMHDIA